MGWILWRNGLTNKLDQDYGSPLQLLLPSKENDLLDKLYFNYVFKLVYMYKRVPRTYELGQQI